jgi:flagellar assembly factor FliW
MQIKSAHFGTVEVNEADLFTFEQGLLGMEEYKRFCVIRPDETLPFGYLQSADECGICLLVADPFAFRPDYEFDMPEKDVAALQSPEPGRITVWVTVSAAESMQKATMNLLAPVVCNTERNIACQIVLHDSGYQTRVPLFPAGKAGE